MSKPVPKDDEAKMNNTLSDLFTKLYEIEAGLAEYSEPRCRQLLQLRIEDLMRGLQQFRDCAAAYNHIQIPTALLSYIDAAGHPDDYIKGLFQQAFIDTQLAAGKVAVLQDMQQSLEAAAAAAYPEAAAGYRGSIQARQRQQQEQQQQQQQQQQQHQQ